MIDFKKINTANWALITGASSGIGKEFAFRFAAQKINLILVARRTELLKELSQQLKNEYQVQVIIIEADLSTSGGINKVIEKTESLLIDILLNNAGIGYTGEYFGMNSDLVSNMINLNTTHYAELTRYFAAKMIKRKKGAIIIISSIVATIPVPYMTLYSATKAFNLAFGEALYYELKKYGIDVLTVCPGSTETEFKGLRANGKKTNIRSVSQVVNTALKNLGKKVVVTDGILNKMSTFFSRFVSRKTRIRLAGKVASKILNQ
jgi:short-subunit dehydrogenase